MDYRERGNSGTERRSSFSRRASDLPITPPDGEIVAFTNIPAAGKDSPPRRPTDIVPPEKFPRLQLDRSIGSINTFYRAVFGLDKTPIQTAIDVLRSNGSVSLLDVGCGTAHSLRTWALAATKAASCSLDKVSMTGISLHDYSEESSHPETIQAIREGKIRYIVGNAAKRGLVEQNSQDVVLAHASLIHNRDPLPIAREMLRVTRPGGVLYFDLNEDQNVSDAPIMNFLFELEDQGFKLDIMPTYVIVGKKELLRNFFRLVKQS